MQTLLCNFCSPAILYLTPLDASKGRKQDAATRHIPAVKELLRIKPLSFHRHHYSRIASLTCSKSLSFDTSWGWQIIITEYDIVT